jgi:serine/threonine protein kinase
LNKKILREVLAISRLHHEYIVRYYQAWVESGNGKPPHLLENDMRTHF